MTFSAVRAAMGTVTRRALLNGLALPVIESFLETASGADTNNFVMNKPSGVVEGDLLVTVNWTSENDITYTKPSGWTQEFQVGQGPSNPLTCGTWWKVAGGSEPSTYTWTGSTPSSQWGTLVRISGFDPSNPINAISQVTASTTLAAITTDRTNCLLLHSVVNAKNFSAQGDCNFTEPGGAETVQHCTSHGGTSGWSDAWAEEPFVTGGGTGTRVWTPTVAARTRVGYLIAISSIAGAASKLEFEASSDNLLLEDASGVLNLE